MRSVKVLGLVLAVASTLAASASAATWDPPGTVIHAHSTTWVITSGTAQVVCTATEHMKFSGAIATTTNVSGGAAGPLFSGCTNNLGLSPTTVTSSSAWTLTATSTTSVDLTNGNFIINIGGSTCIITASSVTIPNNAWSNASHTLTYSSASAFPLTRTGFCPLAAATGTMSGSLTFPSIVVIT